MWPVGSRCYRRSPPLSVRLCCWVACRGCCAFSAGRALVAPLFVCRPLTYLLPNTPPPLRCRFPSRAPNSNLFFFFSLLLLRRRCWLAVGSVLRQHFPHFIPPWPAPLATPVCRHCTNPSLLPNLWDACDVARQWLAGSSKARVRFTVAPVSLLRPKLSTGLPRLLDLFEEEAWTRPGHGRLCMALAREEDCRLYCCLMLFPSLQGPTISSSSVNIALLGGESWRGDEPIGSKWLLRRVVCGIAGFTDVIVGALSRPVHAHTLMCAMSTD